MRLETFQHLIEKIQETQAKSNSIYSLGVDLSSLEDNYHHIITLMLRVYYGSEGEDWISWFLYEKSYDSSLDARNEEGEEICYDVPSLWKHVEEIRVSSDFKEYTVPEPQEINIEDFFSKLYNNGI